MHASATTAVQCLQCGQFILRQTTHKCFGRICKLENCNNKALPRGKCYLHTRGCDHKRLPKIPHASLPKTL